MKRIEVPADRRFLSAWAVVVGLALVVALVSGVVWSRSGNGDDAAARAAVERAAAAAVDELMNFAPDEPAARRAAVADLLTGSLAGDYLTRGPDVVFPGATASRISMSATVLDTGVAEIRESRARAMVFAEQTIRVGDRDEPERVGVARWATLRRVDGAWRLARLEPVSPQ